MTVMESKPATTESGYLLEGTLLEACSCGVLCPCWIGEDPDGGQCFSFNAYHFDRGTIAGVDVSGLNIVLVNHIPGNVLTPASWEVVMFVDDTATDEQKDAIVGAYQGKLGGPLADLAGLIAEVKEVRSVPITHHIMAGVGTLRIDDILEAELEPFRGTDGTITTLRDSLFSTVPGTPAYVAKATTNRVNLPEHGLSWEFSHRNAIQADYRMEFAG
ncbi:MAG TPA: DUF1326 domain-containing protein [Candidatus Limnocylindrales bacterium]|nr:DUF1326 domain-containing protein [Candidatus Limnocylindrales bacterium]